MIILDGRFLIQLRNLEISEWYIVTYLLSTSQSLLQGLMDETAVRAFGIIAPPRYYFCRTAWANLQYALH